ncbi:MAG: MBOAT family O-acyltransferase [Gammaproteobacteria bacterium]
MTFFPHLIAGPVLHHKEMMPQFSRADTYRFGYENIAVGIAIFFVGLFKKVIIADTMAAYASPVFSEAETGGTLMFFTAWEGALAYTFQLYFDFSGYSDMAIGLSRLFGITMPANFDSPYRAVNIVDFWRRWHMTLSRFLRDYLYIPLGGNRKGPVRRYLNLFVTMLLGGMWHGAGWTYIIWGGLHGVYLIVNHFWQAICPWKPGRWWSRFAGRSLTFLSVVIAWVFFRAETFGGALAVLRGMTNLPTTLNGRLGPIQPVFETLGFRFNGGYLASHHLELLGYLIFWMVFIWWLPNTQQIFRDYRPVLEEVRPTEGETIPWLSGFVWRPTWVSGALVATLAILGFLGLSSATEFLYFQF